MKNLFTRTLIIISLITPNYLLAISIDWNDDHPPLENPFITDEDELNGLVSFEIPSFNSKTHSDTFIKNAHLFLEHTDDIRYFFFYAASLDTYVQNYDQTTALKLFKPFLKSFETISFIDNKTAFNKQSDSIIWEALLALGEARNLGILSFQDQLDLFDVRKKNGLGAEDKKSKRIVSTLTNTQKLISQTNNISSISSDADKLKWTKSNTSKKDEILRTLEINQESIDWLISTLFKKNNKRINKSILNKLGENLDNFPENKPAILKFLSTNQSPSYLKIGREFLGEEIIDAITQE